MTLQIVDYKNISKEKWNKFCKHSNCAWFVHTTYWIELILNIRFANNSINHSFAIVENNHILAIAPIVEQDIYKKKNRELGFADLNTPFPAYKNDLGNKQKKKIEKLIFERIISIENIDYSSFYLCPLAEEGLTRSIHINPLPKYGYSETSISTNILSLNKTESDILASMRKGHKSDVKYAMKKEIEITIVDQHNYEADDIETYKKIHFEAAGRKTRPDTTWEMMGGWLEKGLSILVFAKYNGELASVAFVNTYKSKAYYQSAATLPNYERIRGLGHLIQWEIIKYLKNKSFSHYELGWNWYPNISQEVADSKMLAISKFKAGFGADVYPLFRGEIYKNNELFSNSLNKKMEIYKRVYL